MLAAAVSFARSERGRRMINDVRTRLDTPANRAKVKDTITSAKNRRRH